MVGKSILRGKRLVPAGSAGIALLAVKGVLRALLAVKGVLR